MTEEQKLIKAVSEVLNINEEPISDETATIELTIGELFKITEKLRQAAVSGSLPLQTLLNAVSTNKQGKCSHYGVETGGGVSVVRCVVCEEYLQILG